MKKLLSVVLLTFAVSNVQAGTFGKSFGGAFAGSTVSNAMFRAPHDTVDCSYERRELERLKVERTKLKQQKNNYKRKLKDVKRKTRRS